MFQQSRKRPYAESDEHAMQKTFMAEILATNQESPYAEYNSNISHKPFVFQSNQLGGNQEPSHANFNDHTNHDGFGIENLSGADQGLSHANYGASMMETWPSGNQEPSHANLDKVANHEPIATDSDFSDGGTSPVESAGGSIGGSVVSSVYLQDATCTSPAIEESGDIATPNDPDQLGENAARPTIACLRCRGKKSRCSGKQPTCDACSNINKKCTWAVPEGEPTTQRRKSKMKMKGLVPATQSSSAKMPTQVRSACTRCQKRKAKCSGERPTCQYCTDRDFDCIYDVADGATRTEDLKRKVSEAVAQSQDLSQLVEAMRSLPILESTALLARLRLGDPIEEIFESARAALSPASSEH